MLNYRFHPTMHRIVIENTPSLIPSSKSRRKLYLVAGILAIMCIFGAVFLVPQGSGSSIPLSLNYRVGEKMIYNTYETVSQTDQANYPTSPQTINSTATTEIVDFDGKTYTLNHTTTTMLDDPITISFIEKIDRTGYVNYLLPGKTESLFGNRSSNPVLSALLSKPDAKLGDRWQISLNSGNSTIGTTGDLTLLFKSIQDISVPAGKYKAVQIDISSNNLESHTMLPGNETIPGAPGSITSHTTMNFSGQIYLEYGTCRQIKSEMQISIVTQSTLLNSTISYSSSMELIRILGPKE